MITGGVMLQMGKDLREKVNVIETSYQEFEEALQFYFKSPVEKINCLQNLVSSYNELGET